MEIQKAMRASGRKGDDSLPITQQEMTDSIAAIDAEIHALKTQVYKKLLADFEAFSQSFESSSELKDKIDSLLVQADEMSHSIADPEEGLRHSTMAALVSHHEISYKVQENNAIVEGLEHLAEVEDILNEYDRCMESGKVLQAGQCIQHAVDILAVPPNAGVAGSTIKAYLTEQCSRMTGGIDELLNELIHSAVQVSHTASDHHYSVTLTISYDIAVPALLTTSLSGKTETAIKSPPSIKWHELLRALVLLGNSSQKLLPLQKNFIRFILEPLIQNFKGAKLECSSQDTTLGRFSLVCESNPQQQQTVAPEDIFETLSTLFTAIHRDVFLYGSSSPDYSSSDAHILTQTVGQEIARAACMILVHDYLSITIPTDANELENFGTVAAAALKFEDLLIDLGFLTSKNDGGNFHQQPQQQFRILQPFVDNISTHFTNRKRDHLLKLSRAIIMNDNFEEIRVADLDKNDPLEKESGSWSRIRDPDTDMKGATVSVKATSIISLMTSTLDEAKTLDSKAAPHLLDSTRSVIDLYRSLTPVHHAWTLTNVPALAILFCNDCMYMARELEKMPERFEDGLPGVDEVDFDRVIPQLKALSKKWLEVQVDRQKVELMACLDEADGFRDTGGERDEQENKSGGKKNSNHGPGRAEMCERAMRQVSLVFVHLCKAWQPLMSPGMFFRTLGSLMDSVVIRLIQEVEDLGDISEKESHQLALILGVLFECEDHFDAAGPSVIKELNNGQEWHDDPIHFFVKHWTKYQQLVDILELSFAEIMTRFRSGQLHMFTQDELSKLITALFADSPLRQRNLDEIFGE